MTPERAHAEAERELLRAEAERDKAYRERAALVAYLAACYPAEVWTDPAGGGWDVVAVETPAGQMSWHIAQADMSLFAHVTLRSEEDRYDGHTTEAKYERLAELTDRIARAGGFAGVIAATATARPAPLAEGSLKDLKSVTAEHDELRGLLDEIGVTAANAPEDGDSFGLLEQIARRPGARGAPPPPPGGYGPARGTPGPGPPPGAAAAGDGFFPGGDPRDNDWIGGYRPGIEGD